jgi:hypothetical protein
LAVFERRRGEIRVGNGIGIVHRDFAGLDRSGLDEAAMTPSDTSAASASSRHQPLPLADPLQRLRALGGEALGHEAGGAIFGDGAAAVERGGGGERHAQDGGLRRQVVIGGPLDQAAQRGWQRRQLVRVEQRAQAIVADAFRLEAVLLPDHPGHLPRTERGEHDRARRDAHAVRHAVVERPKGGIEQEDADAGHRG